MLPSLNLVSGHDKQFIDVKLQVKQLTSHDSQTLVIPFPNYPLEQGPQEPVVVLYKIPSHMHWLLLNINPVKQFEQLESDTHAVHSDGQAEHF